jgi:hypothetical protein
VATVHAVVLVVVAAAVVAVDAGVVVTNKLM